MEIGEAPLRFVDRKLALLRRQEDSVRQEAKADRSAVLDKAARPLD